MEYPDQLRQPAPLRRPGFGDLCHFLEEMAIWDQAVERVVHDVCRTGTDTERAEAAERLLDRHLLAEPAMAYAAARLLADLGALKHEGRALHACRNEGGASGGGGGPGSADGPAAGRDADRSRGMRAAMRQRPGVHVLCITGLSGVGKTRLADEILTASAAREGAGPRLHVCLRPAASAFGIGQLAIAPHDALRDALVQLGVGDEDIPVTTAGRRDRYVSELAGRRPVILIDGAVDESQVRPLIPPGDGLVVVTSRGRLTELSDYAVEFLPLQPLPPHGSRLLARKCLQVRGLEPDDATIRAIHEMCGGMPVPTMVVSRWLAARQAEGQPLGTLTGRLDAARRAETSPGYPASEMPAFAVVAAVFGLLDDDQRAVLRVLGLLRLPAYDVRALSLGTGLSQTQVRAALERLAVLDLVEKGVCDQHWLTDPHIADYASAYALTRAPHPEAEFEQVLGRVVSVYRWRAEGLRDLMSPARLESSPPLRAWSQAEWQAERDTYAGVVGAAAACLRPALARGLAAAFLESLGDIRYEAARYLSPILQVARDAGDHQLQARALLRFGLALSRQGEAASAAGLLAAATQSARLTADPALLEDIERARGHVPAIADEPQPGRPGDSEPSPGQRADGLARITAIVQPETTGPSHAVLFGAVPCAP